MKIFRGLRHPGIAPACALTVGNFDGVHLGHQAMLALLRAEGHDVPDTALDSVAAQLPEEDREAYLRAVALVNAAAFSGQRITEEERREVRELLRHFCRRTEETQPVTRRLLLRWGLWLY